jgi:hypothetical protein
MNGSRSSTELVRGRNTVVKSVNFGFGLPQKMSKRRFEENLSTRQLIHFDFSPRLAFNHPAREPTAKIDFQGKIHPLVDPNTRQKLPLTPLSVGLNVDIW